MPHGGDGMAYRVQNSCLALEDVVRGDMHRNLSCGGAAGALVGGRVPRVLHSDPGGMRVFLQAPDRCLTPAWKIGRAHLAKFLCERHTPSLVSVLAPHLLPAVL